MNIQKVCIVAALIFLLSARASAESELASISVRDPFARPDVMDVMNTEEGAGGNDGVGDFSLRGLVSGNGKAYALVQNSLGGEFYLRKGDELGSLGKVIGIAAREGVTFRSADNEEVTLKMPRRQ